MPVNDPKFQSEQKRLIDGAKNSLKSEVMYFGFGVGKDDLNSFVFFDKRKAVDVVRVKKHAGKLLTGVQPTTWCAGECTLNEQGGIQFSVNQGSLPASLAKKIRGTVSALFGANLKNATAGVAKGAQGVEVETGTQEQEDEQDDEGQSLKTSTPSEPELDLSPFTSAVRDFLQDLQEADKGIQQLQKTLLQSGHPLSRGVAQGYVGLLDESPLNDIQELAGKLLQNGKDPQKARELAPGLRKLVESSEQFLRSNPIVQDIDENPFHKVPLRAALEPSLAQLRQALSRL